MIEVTQKKETADSKGYGLNRLSFVLPEFTRWVWASDAAKNEWNPRIQAIWNAWREIEWQSVARGVRACAAISIPSQKLPDHAKSYVQHGLMALPLEMFGDSGSTYANQAQPYRKGQPFSYRVIVGSTDSVQSFERAWSTSNHLAVGRLLGYPDCCAVFFRSVWVEQGLRDVTWPMALGTRRQFEVAKDTRLVAGSPWCNALWRWLGVRATFHLPCSFECDASTQVARDLCSLGCELGFQTEMEHLTEILTWPVSWSALHGIAEVKTPLLKLSTSTDATSCRYVVNRVGERYPEVGAKGFGFPYQSWRLEDWDVHSRGSTQSKLAGTAT